MFPSRALALNGAGHQSSEGFSWGIMGNEGFRWVHPATRRRRGSQAGAEIARQDQLERSLDRFSPGEVEGALARLQADGRARVIERYGVRFWSAAGARFAPMRPRARA